MKNRKDRLVRTKRRISISKLVPLFYNLSIANAVLGISMDSLRKSGVIKKVIKRRKTLKSRSEEKPGK